MMESRATLAHHVNKYHNERVVPRKAKVSQTVQDVGSIVASILKEVQRREPRFLGALNETEGRVEGLEVISPSEYQVVLCLNHTGVFTFNEERSIPGCAMLKLSDGRKRSMSLWIEFITASGYLSARKVRSRFLSLVAQVLGKLNYGSMVTLDRDTTEVKLRIRDSIVVRVIPAFKCSALWPNSAHHWPDPGTSWPPVSKIAEVKAIGFNLLSKDCVVTNEMNSSSESDAWMMSFAEAEDRLLECASGCRRRCLSILKTLRDRHLDFSGSPLNNYHMKMLLLYECEKHPGDLEWNTSSIGDRLKLVSCLRCHRLPHYFLPGVDLFATSATPSLDEAARKVWCLTRQIITNSKSFDHL
ncbi:unnamed protein product [Clavelina lepadiformis]|uniref:Protein mab-21-like n=1 Tax=Clavelina lepadiformis TaxID=159417 RepID=A0ABP0FY57_CLALP